MGQHRYLAVALLGFLLAVNASAENTTLTLRGRLMDAEGRPVAGERVLLLCVTPNHVVTPEQAARLGRYHAQTDAEGQFFFALGIFESPLTTGEIWEREHAHPGWGVYYLWEPAGSGSAGALSEPIAHVERDPRASFKTVGLRRFIAFDGSQEVELRRQRGGSIAAQIANPRKEPFEGLTITASLALRGGTPNNDWQKIPLLQSKTDAGGRVEFDDVFPGDVLVEIGASPPFWIRQRQSSADAWSNHPDPMLKINSGRRRTIEIVASNSREFAMEGRVVDEEGNPVAGALVSATPVSRANLRDPFIQRDQSVSAVSGADGRYRLRSGFGFLERLTVEAPGFSPRRIYETADDLIPAEPRDFELTRLHTTALTGTVVDAAGSPVADCPVYLVNMERWCLVNLESAAGLVNYNTVTDARGEFRFLLGHFTSSKAPAPEEIPPYGEYHVVVQPAGSHAGAVSERFLHESKSRPAGWVFSPSVLKLGPGILVSGRVVTNEGEPRAGIGVKLHHDLHAKTHTGFGGEIWEREAVTDSQGRFAFERVCQTDFYLNVATPRAAWVMTRLQGDSDWTIGPRKRWLGEEAARDIDLEIKLGAAEGYRYHGRVTDDNGNGIADAEVFFGVTTQIENQDYGDTHHFERVSTDAGGNYTYQCLYPWLNLIGVDKPGYLRAMIERRPAELAPGRYDLQMKRQY